MRRFPRFQISRDAILFVVGLAGITYETIKGGTEEPTLIIAFVGMMGLPLFIKTDEMRNRPPDPPPHHDQDQDGHHRPSRPSRRLSTRPRPVPTPNPDEEEATM